MGYESYGGIKSIDFSSAELERAGSGLGNCSAALGEAALILGTPGGQIPAAVLGSVALRFRVLDAQREYASLQGVCLRLAADSAGLSLKVRTARSVYELAEARASAAARRAGAGSLGWRLLLELLGPNQRPSTLTTESLISQAPALVGRLLGLLPGFGGAGFLLPMMRDTRHGGLFDESVARRLYPLLGGVTIDSQEVRVGPVDVGEIRSAAPRELTPGLNGLMELQSLAEQAPPGSLLITTVPTDEGQLHIVTIPGTQSTELFDPALLPRLPGGESARPLRQNPWDTGGIVESMGMRSQHTADAVSVALAESGAHQGDRVILSGYSQGGIHAANLAADTRITSQYSVRYVLSVGAPVAGIELPDAVRGLHLEDRGDLVPGTDGESNPDLRNRVTINFDSAKETVTETGSLFGPAHRFSNYAGKVARMKPGSDPAVDEAVGALGVLFLGAGAATVRTVQLRRAAPVQVMRGIAPPPRHSRVPALRKDWAPGP